MSCFDPVADAYDQGRPSYPSELYDAVEELSGVTLRGAAVVDVCAGTGIATRGLLTRGADVAAVEIGARMLAALRVHTPEVAVVRGDANVLPLRDGVADLVTYAQAWHWTDPPRSLSEARRVLRPDGALAVWWNIPDREAAAWLREHERRLARACPEYHGYLGAYIDSEAAARYGFVVRTTKIPWSRTIPLEDFLAALRSKSYVDALGAAEADSFVAAEQAVLSETFPEGTLEEPFSAHLTVARKRP